MKASLRCVATLQLCLGIAFTFVNTAWAQQGAGNALRFDSTGDSMLVVHTNALNAFPLTVTAWLRTTQAVNFSFPPIVSKLLANGQTNGWQVYLNSGIVRARYFADGSNFLSGNNTGLLGGLNGGSVADDVFHHVAFTVDAGAGSLYVDGVLRDTRAWVGTPGAPTTTELVRLGLWNNSSFVGTLDEVTIWNLALTAGQIQTNMHRSLVGTEPGLIAYYRFNESSGSTTADGAPAGGDNVGILTGTPSRIPSGVALQPLATTLSASGLTQTSATLNGSANPDNASASAWFEYGFTTNYGNATPPQTVGSANASTNFSEALTGLQAGVSYHFRAVASNSFGVSFGQDQSFPSFAQVAYLKASNVDTNNAFGVAIAMDGDTIIVGAPFGDSHGPEAGAAYVFVRRGESWVQQAYLKASNAGRYDHFGSSVALAGDAAVVGAPGEYSNATGVNGNQGDDSMPAAGAAYVFVRTGTNWSQQAYLKASNTERDDEFGYSVAISGDTVVVGADREAGSATGVNGNQSFNNFPYAGAAYVFVRSGTNWSQQAYLKASNTDSNDVFGSSVAISGDTVMVGAPGEDSNATGINGNQGDNSASAAGAAYVFVRSGATWTQQAYLKASNTGATDQFGTSVALSGDTIIVGAAREDSNATGVNGSQNDNSAADSGAAYVFVRNGATWTQQAYLKASNTGASDGFGSSVAAQGDTVVVGAGSDSFGFVGEDGNAMGVNGNQNDNSAPDSGAAYVFVRSGATWSFRDYLKASNTDSNDIFGTSVAVSGDTVVVGAENERSNATGVNSDQSDNSVPFAGAAYVFGPPLPPSPVIAVLLSGTNVLNGGTIPQIVAAISKTFSRTLTVRNTGNGPLTPLIITFDGPDAAMFSVTHNPTVPVAPGSNTTFNIGFTPTSVGTKSATLHIASNDQSQNPFDIQLSGLSLSFTEDRDGDGLNDATELLLSSLGFDFQSFQPNLVNTLFNNLGHAASNLNAAGFFTQSQLQALNVNSPLLARDPNTGLFKLTIGVEKATQLTNFLPFPMAAPQTTINSDGKLEFQFGPTDNAAFFRLESR